jgi:hypothetical protein
LPILQHDRLQRATVCGFNERRNLIVRDTAMEADVDCRPAEMAVEDRLRRLQAHFLVAAVEQLG